MRAATAVLRALAAKLVPTPGEELTLTLTLTQTVTVTQTLILILALM